MQVGKGVNSESDAVKQHVINFSVNDPFRNAMSSAQFLAFLLILLLLTWKLKLSVILPTKWAYSESAGNCNGASKQATAKPRACREDKGEEAPLEKKEGRLGCSKQKAHWRKLGVLCQWLFIGWTVAQGGRNSSTGEKVTTVEWLERCRACERPLQASQHQVSEVALR